MDGGTVIWIVILWVYFFPTLIAWKRRHRQGNAIFALNLFLGWSGFGWLGCLVWALLEERGNASE
jgi:hypothetical protein